MNIGGQWTPDPNTNVRCFENKDSTIYMSLRGDPRQLSGFYVQIGSRSSKHERPIYSKIRSESEETYYLFYTNGEWIVGTTPGVQQGVAFIRLAVDTPHDIGKQRWKVHVDGAWRPVLGVVLAASSEQSVYQSLRQFRDVSPLPVGQSTFTLRNGMAIPAVGLGMGGLPAQGVLGVVSESIQVGYRLFDTAREYGNEWAVREGLRVAQTSCKEASAGTEGECPTRRDIFVMSKVWPTHLGADPTANELSASLRELQSAYVNLYFLHWPL